MNANAVILSKKIQISSGKTVGIKDGSSVYVRVIKPLGDDKYLGTLRRVFITLHSKKPLFKGDVFKATFTKQDGLPTLKNLQLVNKKAAADGIEIKTLSADCLQNAMEEITDQNLSSFIRSMGLPPDNLSFFLLQQMKNFGFKHNPNLLNRLHEIAQKYSGKEKFAVELMMELLEKGIEFAPDEIGKIIDCLENDEECLEQNNQHLKTGISSKEIKDFFLSLLFEESDREAGLLSVGNSLGSSKDSSSNGSWILLPYEVREQENLKCSGIFRILLSDEQKLIKFCVENRKSNLNQIFVLNFSFNECKKIELCQIKNDVEDCSEDLLDIVAKKLKEQNKNIEVQIGEFEKLCGNQSGKEVFVSLNGEV